jgi:hypothetical protein
MIDQLPRDWATNANYSTGPDSGTPTKVDPASDANGFISGNLAAPQHVNYVLHGQSGVSRKAFELAALRLREVRRSGLTVTDTAASLGAAQRDATSEVLVAKTAQAFGISDWDLISTLGVPTEITSLLTDACRIPAGAHEGRLYVVGTGGAGYSYSDDDGQTWQIAFGDTIGNAAGASVRIAANSTGTIVAVGRPGHADLRVGGPSSNFLTATPHWTGVAGVAYLGTTFIVLDTVSPVAFRNASGTTSGTVANAATLVEEGTLIGNQGATIYHAARTSGGVSVQVSSSINGGTWITTATIANPGSTFASAPRIMMCQNTGLLVLAAPLTSGLCALYASFDGADWVGPQLVSDPGVNAFALAGGRLLATFGAALFASDGIGTL